MEVKEEEILCFSFAEPKPENLEMSSISEEEEKENEKEIILPACHGAGFWA